MRGKLCLQAAANLVGSCCALIACAVNNASLEATIAARALHEEQTNAARKARELSKAPVSRNKGSSRGKLQPIGPVSVRLEHHTLDSGTEFLIRFGCRALYQDVAADDLNTHMSRLNDDYTTGRPYIEA
jgi:hypothetical protein